MGLIPPRKRKGRSGREGSGGRGGKGGEGGGKRKKGKREGNREREGGEGKEGRRQRGGESGKEAGRRQEEGRRGRKESRPGRLSSVRPASRAAVTCSPAFAVPSAPRGLTSLFGMGRGGAPVLSPPWSFAFPGRAPPGGPSPLPHARRAGRCVPEGGLPEAKRDPRRHDGVPLAGPVPGPAHPVCSRSSSAAIRFRGGAGIPLSGVSGLLVPLG